MVDQSEVTNRKMTTFQIIVLRVLIVLGMVAAVVTILYFTPLPDHNFKSCDRPCHELDWPMICRVKLNIELYQSMSGACKNCPNNSLHCNQNYCSAFENAPRSIITANGQIPGPPIKVCHNDVLVIDVFNSIPAHTVSLHWRGQLNNETPFMDGVPMITQCPISSYTTFQYRLRASVPGTHLYQAFSDSDRSEGLYGAFIVKQPQKSEYHRKQYDVDSRDHVVILSEWGGDLSSDQNPKSILINGRAPSTDGSSLTTFHVTRNTRYRFRLGYGGGLSGCPITVSVDGHLLKIIALDGNGIVPHQVNSFTLAKGERVDFVLRANQEPNNYVFRAYSKCGNNELEGVAVISYDETPKRSKFAKKLDDEAAKVMDTSLCQASENRICLQNIKSVGEIPTELKEEVERQVFLVFDKTDIMALKDRNPFTSGKFHRVNNLTFAFPSSPILTQPDDVPLSTICNELKIPDKCLQRDKCECTHVEHIPLGAVTEIVLVNFDQDKDEHVFHLHGYQFYVIGSREFAKPVPTERIKKMDKYSALFKRNFHRPVVKDTLRLARNSAVAIRFLANNPGFWMLRDENSNGWTRGMDVVFQVGDEGDIISTPTSFPTCGSYIGPDFFLI